MYSLPPTLVSVIGIASHRKDAFSIFNRWGQLFLSTHFANQPSFDFCLDYIQFVLFK